MYRGSMFILIKTCEPPLYVRLNDKKHRTQKKSIVLLRAHDLN